MRNIYILILMTLVFFNTIAKEHTNNEPNALVKCGTPVPSLKWEMNFQKHIQNYEWNKKNNPNAKNAEESIVIPVIVHVIYDKDTVIENITKAQIDSQFVILNRNYAGNSAYKNNIPSAFLPRVANTNISFCPALVDPSGNVLLEPGINRISRTSVGFSSPGSKGWTRTYIDNTIKPNTIWNPRYYLNIWVVPKIRTEDGDVLLGYATFPESMYASGEDGDVDNSKTDGVVCAARGFGKSSTNYTEYNDGGTATHEIGHWLGLRHIWGDENCGNDFCNDTPLHEDANYGCPEFPHITSCGNSPNGEMFMNYMDYTDDYCTNMFTLDQKVRMMTSMNTDSLRNALLSSPVCNSTMQEPLANFNYALTSTDICGTQKYNFFDKSMWNKNATSWTWTFQDATPTTSSVKNPTDITFNSSGEKQVTLTIVTPLGTSTVTKKIIVAMVGNSTLPLLENFEGSVFPPNGWVLKKRSVEPNLNWELRKGYSAFGLGNQSMIFNNTEYDGKKKIDDILSPKINLTGVTQAKIKFDVAYAPYYVINSDNSIDIQYDKLEVHLTTNCGTTSTSVYKKEGTALATYLPGIGEEFYPTASQWRTDSIDIPASFLNKADVQLVFRNYGMYGHTIYIDNINVYNTQPAAVVLNPNFTMSKSEICIGESITLNNTTPELIDSLRWNISGGNPFTSNNSNLSVQYGSSGNYNIQLTVFKNNSSSTITKTIKVNSKPTVSISPANTTICVGQSVTLIASGASSYAWSTGQSGNTIVVNPSVNSTYKVLGIANNCTSDSAIAIVNITTTNPTVSITKSPNVSTICEGDSVTLTASGANNYTWSTGANTAVIKVKPTVNTNYIVTGSLTGCSSLSGQANTSINVNPKPTIGEITRGGWDTIYVSPANGVSYQWYFNNNTTAIATTSVPYYFATQEGNYKVQVSDNKGCKSDKSLDFGFVLSAIKNNATSIKLNIYPNPNQGTFKIELSANKHSIYQVKLHTITGSEVWSDKFEVFKGLNSKSVEIKNLSKGIYLLNLNNEDGIATYQLLVQ
ncbi:MAG TPA: M43 family zinc metalloprotease [Chitinophagales bacterium]|nr:M43 family zinc metalloprotease [Chitinophagales bacterium]